MTLQATSCPRDNTNASPRSAHLIKACASHCSGISAASTLPLLEASWSCWGDDGRGAGEAEAWAGAGSSRVAGGQPLQGQKGTHLRYKKMHMI